MASRWAGTRRLAGVRVVAEFTTEPFRGEVGLPEHASRAWEIVQTSGLDGDLGPLGTMVAGECDRVLDTLREVMSVALECGATRITLQLRTDE